MRACADNDLVFIGPGAEVMEEMGDKVRAKAAMAEAGVPVVPGTDGVATAADARAAADDLGYPVLLKAAAGGGGKGMRLVSSAAELEETFQTASAEALAAFGDGRIYVEQALVPARHVEVQVLADGDGNVLTLGERECSIQRRHQKLVEESPSPALTPEQREAMEEAAERACRAVGYLNAGTFEFLVGPDGSFYFIELNARLQVEHPVTELVTGLDLVREQLRIAAGRAADADGASTARRPRDRGAAQRRGPRGKLRSLTRPRDTLPATARAVRPAGHAHRGGNRGIAALRLAAREAHRVGSRPRRRDRPLPPGAFRAGDRGRAHDARARDRHHAFGGIRVGPLLDVVPRRSRRAAGAGATMKELARTQLGRIAVEPKALDRLVRDAAASVEGAKVVQAAVSLEEGSAATVTVTAPRGAVLPELGALVQQRIADALRQALDATPSRVDVTIEAIEGGA